eukprot:gene6865-22915_t
MGTMWHCCRYRRRCLEVRRALKQPDRWTDEDDEEGEHVASGPRSTFAANASLLFCRFSSTPVTAVPHFPRRRGELLECGDDGDQCR